MHFSKIYLQQNFVPDIVADQFGRKVIGIEVTLNEGESLDVAKDQAEAYIKDYIQRNTVIPPHNHIEERYIPEAELPSIQVDRTELISLEEQIEACTELEELKTFRHVATKTDAGWATYNKKLKQLQP